MAVPLNSILRNLLLWGLVLAGSFQTASLTWSLFAPAPALPVHGSTNAPSIQSQPLDLSALQRHNLFGVPKAVAAPSKPEPVKTQVKSRLAVKLLGIIKGSSPDAAVAILSERNQQRAYAVGDRLTIDNRAELVEIQVDRVVIELAGQRQYIELEKAVGGPAKGIDPVVSSEEGGVLPTQVSLSQPNIAAVLGNVREKIVSDPLSFGRFIQLRPYAVNGRIVGYQLHPGRDSRLFKQLGLQAGDLVTHVGDVDITDPRNVPQLMNMVQSEQSLRIGIRRGDSDQDIDVEF